MARYGVRYGTVRFGSVRFGSIRQRWQVLSRFVFEHSDMFQAILPVSNPTKTKEYTISKVDSQVCAAGNSSSYRAAYGRAGLLL